MLDVNSLLQVGGLAAIGLVVLAESALLVGLFLPGDTLLIAGGIFAAQHKLPLLWLILVCAVATICGYELGYSLGRKAGPRIFRRKDGLLFREDYMSHTEDFFKRHGWKTILIARFIAIVRTIVPLVAGMGKMDRRVFFFFNVIGGSLWSSGVILASYWIGQKVPHLDSYIKYLVLLAVLATTSGVVIELIKNKRRRREIFDAFKQEYKYLFKKN